MTLHGPGFIYFAQAESGGPVKVGFSKHPETRMKQIASARKRGPMRLLGYFPGTWTREQRIHRDLAEWRVMGEWYDPAAPSLQALRKYLITEPSEPGDTPSDQMHAIEAPAEVTARPGSLDTGVLDRFSTAVDKLERLIGERDA